MEEKERQKLEQRQKSEVKTKIVVHVEDSNQMQESSMLMDVPSENFVDETIQERQSIGDGRPAGFSKSGIVNIKVSQPKDRASMVNQLLMPNLMLAKCESNSQLEGNDPHSQMLFKNKFRE